MVLQELGNKISQALASVNEAPAVDDAVLDECLKAIAAALLQVRHDVLALPAAEPCSILCAAALLMHRALLHTQFAPSLAWQLSRQGIGAMPSAGRHQALSRSADML